MERENHKMTFKALNMSAKKARPTEKLKNQKLGKNIYVPAASNLEQSPHPLSIRRSGTKIAFTEIVL